MVRHIKGLDMGRSWIFAPEHRPPLHVRTGHRVAALFVGNADTQAISNANSQDVSLKKFSVLYLTPKQLNIGMQSTGDGTYGVFCNTLSSGQQIGFWLNTLVLEHADHLSAGVGYNKGDHAKQLITATEGNFGNAGADAATLDS